MPFKSQAQQAACYAKHDPNWDCQKWSAMTNQSSLPDRVGKAVRQQMKQRVAKHG